MAKKQQVSFNTLTNNKFRFFFKSLGVHLNNVDQARPLRTALSEVFEITILVMQ